MFNNIKNKARLVSLLIISLFSIPAFSQPGPSGPPPPPCWPPPCNVPINSGILLILAAGLVYGGYVLFKMQKRNPC